MPLDPQVRTQDIIILSVGESNSFHIFNFPLNQPPDTTVPPKFDKSDGCCVLSVNKSDVKIRQNVPAS